MAGSDKDFGMMVIFVLRCTLSSRGPSMLRLALFLVYGFFRVHALHLVGRVIFTLAGGGDARTKRFYC